ncbi:hypothetical protein JCM15765_28780 [Paradesulfitobacterium aromaticivorans]
MENAELATEVMTIASKFMRLDDEQGLEAVSDALSKIERSLTTGGLRQEFKMLLEEGLVDINSKNYVHLADLLLYRIVPFIKRIPEEAI